jgi:hypothetical protein
MIELIHIEDILTNGAIYFTLYDKLSLLLPRYNNAEILLLTGQLAMRYKEAKTTNLKIYLLMRLNFGKEQ